MICAIRRIGRAMVEIVYKCLARPFPGLQTRPSPGGPRKGKFAENIRRRTGCLRICRMRIGAFSQIAFSQIQTAKVTGMRMVSRFNARRMISAWVIFF